MGAGQRISLAIYGCDQAVDASWLIAHVYLDGAISEVVPGKVAKQFLYGAVISGSDGQPEVLNIILDDTLNTNKKFSKGTVITFSLPLVILNSGTFKDPVTATLTPTASKICYILRPRKPEGELYTRIVRQIGVGITTEDPRRTLFIKYQPNTPGLYRAACRDQVVGPQPLLTSLECCNRAQ